MKEGKKKPRLNSSDPVEKSDKWSTKLQDRRLMKKADREKLAAPESNFESQGASPVTMINYLPVLAALTAILPVIIKRSPEMDIIKISVLTLILTAAATFFIRMNAEDILSKRLSKTIIIISYLFSIVIIMAVPHPEIICFWMIGGLTVSMLIDNRLGLLLHFNLCFILGIFLSLRPETVIYLMVMGVLMSLLSSFLRQKSSFIYAAIIILSTSVTLAFLINNFVFETAVSYNYVSSFFSILAVLSAAFVLCLIYQRRFGSGEEAADVAAGKEVIENKTSETNDYGINAAEITATDIESVYKGNQHFGSRTSYELLDQPDNTLLLQLKEHSEESYEHSLQIGDISGRAAKEIGADEALARIGGMYHEIGKINGRNYIEEGIKIAKEYDFPQELILIIKQHNIRYDKPASREAAIVMLSDNVVSTIEYIEKTEKIRFAPCKIIDQIFQMRMDKGTFDQAGLSLKDFKCLKDFYQREYQ